MSFGRLDMRWPILAFAVLAALLATSTGHADAASTVTIQHRTRAIAGDAADDKVALRPAASSPNRLEIDLGADGTADVVVGRGAFDRIRVDGGDGFDSVTFAGTAAGDRFDVTASGPLVRLRDGGRAPATLDKVEVIGAATLGGPDTVSVGEVSGTDLQELDAARARPAAERPTPAPTASSPRAPRARTSPASWASTASPSSACRPSSRSGTPTRATT
jgi:hypothetical protein